SRMLAVASLLALGVGALGWARADAPDPATQAFAQRLAIGVCGTCHGPHGNSGQPKFPRLAGQSGNYLVAQLKNFRGQTRGDPDAIGYMWGMAAELDDPTIEALAKYYSSQQPLRGRALRRGITAEKRVCDEANQLDSDRPLARGRALPGDQEGLDAGASLPCPHRPLPVRGGMRLCTRASVPLGRRAPGGGGARCL